MSKDMSVETSPRRQAPGQAVRVEEEATPVLDDNGTYASSTPEPTKKRHCSGPDGV